MAKKKKKSNNSGSNYIFPDIESAVMSTDMTGAIPTPPRTEDELESLNQVIRTNLESK